MPLNFPSNPSLNDTYTVGDKKWVYDGKGWKLFSAASELVPGIYNHANGAFDKANSANVLAQAAFNQANSISLTGYATETFVVNSIANLVNSAPTTLDTLNELASALGNDANFSTTVTNLIGSAYNQANASNVLAQSSYTHANGSFDKANSANVLAQQAYNQANTGTTVASNAFSHANGAFDKANSANTLAQSSFDKANSANVLAQAAFNQANTANLLSVSSSIIPSANITYDLGTPTQRWRDLYLSGNTIDLAGVQISANNGGLTLPPVVAIGNTTIDGTSGGLILPSNTSIGGSAVATPRVSSIDYPGDDTAANPTGGQVIGIVGSGFQSGASVILDGQTISVVTYVNSQRLEITTPAKATGSYIMYIVNPDGGTGIFVPGVQYSGVPTWQSPAAGSLGSVYETNNVNATFSANSDSAVTYSLFSGTLPPGSTLNSSTGVLSGTAALTDNATTYNFTIRATDAENQDTDRAFSLTINPDVITWVSPANGASYQAIANSAIPSVSLSATSAAGDSVVYTANALPTGISISGSSITGTPTTEQTLSSLITARGNTTNSTATIVLNWSVVVRDLFFRETTLLLNANTNTWITDESPNGFEITPFGDAKPSAFSPFNTNWSNFFDGNGDNLQIAHNSALTPTGDFCIEFWAYPTSTAGTQEWYSKAAGIQIYITSGNWGIALSSLNNTTYYASDNSRVALANVWQHLALTRSGNIYRWFVNGQQVYTITSSSSPNTGTDTLRIGDISVGPSYPAVGYISNVRYVNGSPVYTSAFTPPTSPLTAVANTVLLTCQSNRFIDNSTNNFAITRNGDVRVTSFGPFTETDTTTGSGFFDGTGDYIDTPSSPNFGIGSGDFTIECWIWCNSTANFPIFYDFRSTQPEAAPSLYIAGNNRLNYLFNSGTPVAFGPNPLLTNTWHHVAWVRSGTTHTLYYNGVSQATFTNSAGVSSSMIRLAGRQAGGLDNTAYFNGYMADFRFVKTAVYTSNFTPPTAPLTPVANTQLLTLQNRTAHNNNTFLDESGNKFNITRSGNATQGSFSPFSPSGWSAYFDGTGDGLQTTALNLSSGNFTIEAWVNLNTLPTTNSWPASYSNWMNVVAVGTANLADGWQFRIGQTVLAFGTNNDTTAVSGTHGIVVGSWNHLACVRNGNVYTLYVNGLSVASATYTANQPGTGAFTWIGNETNQGAYLNGYISNLRIVSGTALYTSNFTPSTTPIEPVANTVLLTCRSNRFEDEGPNRFTITRNGDTRITPFSPFGPHTITPKTYSVFCNNDGVSTTFSNTPTEFDFGSGNFTIELWVNPSSLASTSGLFAKTTDPSKASGYLWTQAAINTNGTIQGSISTSSGSWAVNAATTSTIGIGSWSHIAVVRNGSDFSVYVNGVKNTLSSSLSGSISIDSASLTVGRIGTTASYFGLTGYVSNFRVVKGTAVYTSNFTPSTVALTAIVNTQMLSCQSESLIDNSNNRYTITGSTNTTPSKYNPFGETVATNVQYSPTVHGGSSYHDGSGDYLTIPPNSALAFGTGDFTIEFWLNSTVFSRDPYDRRIIRCIANPSTGAGAGFGIALNGDPSTGVGQLGAGTEGFSATGLTTTRTVCDSGWHHIVFGRKSSMLYLFLDGILQGSVSNSNNITDPSTYNTHIGWFGTEQGFYNGYLSNFKITKGTFTYPTSNFVPPLSFTNTRNVSSLDLNFNKAGISDATSKNVLETVGDVEVITESPYSLNQSVYFDGNGDSLTTPANTAFAYGTGDFTIEAWVYQTQRNSLSDICSCHNYGTGADWLFSINSSGNLYFQITGSATGAQTSTGTVPLNTWSHVAVTRSGGVVRQFINGTQVSSATYSTSVSSTITFSIGAPANLNASGTFYGYISNLRINKGTALHTTNFTPSTTPLTVVSGTSLLTCQSNRFVDNSTNAFTITRNGNAKITSRGPFTETRPPRSLKFDGTGDYLKIPYTPNLWFGSSNWTFEAWIYPLSFTDNNVIFDFGYGTPDTLRSIIFYTAQTTGLFRIAQSPNGSTNYDVSTGITLSLNQWHHIACVRNGASIVSYFNGVNTSSITAYDTFNSTSRSFFIGIQGDLQEVTTSHAYVEDLRITKYARYTSNFTPPTTTFLTF